MLFELVLALAFDTCAGALILPNYLIGLAAARRRVIAYHIIAVRPNIGGFSTTGV